MEMYIISDDIMKRLDIRAMGQKTLGLYCQADPTMEELEHLLSQAEARAYQDGYWDIYSCRKLFGPVIVFLKKCVRKLLKILLGWYIFPIYKQQSEFNQAVLDIVRKQNNFIMLMQGHIEELEKKSNDVDLEEK